jgi:simple sugar transport system substrate-binding protein
MFSSTNLVKRSLLKCALLIGLVVLGLGSATAFAEYRFIFISHMGPHDSNSKWFEVSLKEFEQKFPDVKTEYWAPEKYSNEEFISLIEKAIASEPDGIAITAIDPAAIEDAVQKAIDKGIPVMCFNTADPRPESKRIPYMAYVGTDSYLDGKRAAEHALAAARAGKVPRPFKVLCVNPDARHLGLVARCRGMADGMGEELVPTEVLVTDLDPTKAAEILRNYLETHRDINYLYAPSTDSAPVVWKVANDLGLHPDADMEGVTVMTVDAHPISLWGVAEGHLLSTISQGFWLQGWEPASWLYWKNVFGYEPSGNIYTGPVIIDKTNVAHWEKFIRNIFGDEFYDSHNPWPGLQAPETKKDEE